MTKPKQDSLDASVVFGEAIVKNGWSRSHQVRILLNFIGKSGYTQSLKDYLNEKPLEPVVRGPGLHDLRDIGEKKDDKPSS